MNGFTGTAGATFTNNQAFNYVQSSASLRTLTSPAYPTFNTDGTAKATSDWDHITFNSESADNGTFGTPVKVLYSYTD